MPRVAARCDASRWRPSQPNLCFQNAVHWSLFVFGSRSRKVAEIKRHQTSHSRMKFLQTRLAWDR